MTKNTGRSSLGPVGPVPMHLNGHDRSQADADEQALNQAETELVSLGDAKAQAQRKIDEALAEQDRIINQEREAQQRRDEALKARRTEHRHNASRYREWAMKAEDRAKADQFLGWADDEDRLAREIVLEGDLPEPELTPPAAVIAKPTFWATGWGQFAMGAIQLVLLLVVLNACYDWFHSMGHDIKADNVKAMREAQRTGESVVNVMRPYDATTYQRYLLESFAEFMDLPKVLLKLFFIAPFLLFYLYRRFRADFLDGLTPFQRCLLVILFLGFLLVHSGLSHLVKTD